MKMAFLSVHSSPLGPMGTRDTGGMSAYLLGLSQALDEMGHSVDIFTGAELNGETPQQIGSSAVRLITIKKKRSGASREELFSNASQLAAQIGAFIRRSQVSYDLIFSHYWLSGLAGRTLNRDLKLPHLVMFHTLGRAKNESCSGEHEPMLRLEEENKLAAGCDMVVTASRLEQEKVCSYFSLPKERVAVIGSGINRAHFTPLERKRAREKAGVSGYKVMLAVGRIEPVKGFELLIEAAALLPLEDPFRVIIVGGDSADAAKIAALKELAASRGVSDRLHFTGRIEHKELPIYYSAADVTVIPSFYESFSMVALESIACGTPVVSGPVGVIPELAEGEAGEQVVKLVGDRSPAAWAAAIRKVYLGENRLVPVSIDSCLAPYNWHSVAEKLVQSLKFQQLSGR